MTKVYFNKHTQIWLFVFIYRFENIYFFSLIKEIWIWAGKNKTLFWLFLYKHTIAQLLRERGVQKEVEIFFSIYYLYFTYFYLRINLCFIKRWWFIKYLLSELLWHILSLQHFSDRFIQDYTLYSTLSF